MAGADLTLPALREAYAQRRTTPLALLESLYPLLVAETTSFIILAPLAHIQERCRYLESLPENARPSLWGVPFAVKDNIDALPYPTTAACPAFSYMPNVTAPAVQAILDAGAIMVGKTNMDQFAAGLVGTRTPYGTARNAFDDRFVPGGSSSGSGALVGSGLVTFALGTDTAGSGRVPAMLNGCVGIKPTVGRVSSSGVVPACRSLDCISCFARTVQDGAFVTKLMQSAGKLQDSCWKPPPQGLLSQTSLANGNEASSTPSPQASTTGRHSAGRFRFGVPGPKFLEFAGPGGSVTAKAYEAAFLDAIARMQQLGGELVPVDFTAFCDTAQLLYNSAFVAERYAGIRQFLESPNATVKEVTTESVEADRRMEAVTAAIIARGTLYNAADVYQAFTQLSELQSRTRTEMAKVDLLLVPTVLQNYLIAEIEAEEKICSPPTWDNNTLSGRFTNFVNLLDMAAVSVPSTLIHCTDLSDTDNLGEGGSKPEVARRARILRETGNPTPVLPVGVTLIGPAWTDEFLWEVAAGMHAESGLGCGPEGHGVEPYRQPTQTPVTPTKRTC